MQAPTSFHRWADGSTFKGNVNPPPVFKAGA